MTISLIFLILSILGLAALFYIKSYELKTGKAILRDFRDRFDGPILVFEASTKFFWRNFNIRIFMRKTAFYIVHVFNLMLDGVKQVIDLVQNEMNHLSSFLKG